jgi:AcrR family transcriptional regulator
VGSEKVNPRKAEIAEAARALIAERGFEGLRTRDIAERVGINVATLHYHVPTKESLIEIVAQSMRDDFIAQGDARPREGKSPLERLHQEFDDFRETLSENPELFVVFSELLMRSKRDPNIASAMRPMQAHWHAQWTDLLEAGRKGGAFRQDMDASAAATMIISALVGSQRMPGDKQARLHDVTAEIERSIRNPFPETKKDPQ